VLLQRNWKGRQPSFPVQRDDRMTAESTSYTMS
jgi:hypothetical protein